MCDDDSFNVATVPRHAVFGGQADSGDGDDESTLGDRFFDLLPLHANNTAMAHSGHCMPSHDSCKLLSSDVQQQREQIPKVIVTTTTAVTYAADADKFISVGPADASAENINDDVPFELNRLAMFRPPSRTRLSGRRSNTVPREENTVHLSACAAESGYRPNGHADRTATGRSSKIPSSGSNQTLRCSASRPLCPAQVRQRSLVRDKNRMQSFETKRMESEAHIPAAKVRAASAEPRIKRPIMGLAGTQDPSVRKKTETAARIQPCRPVRVRSASTSAPATRNFAMGTGNTVKTSRITPTQRQSGIVSSIRTVVNAEKVVSKSGAIRKSPYSGPETRARARIKRSDENMGEMKSSSTVSTPKKSTLMKPLHVRPLTQLNQNIPRNVVVTGTAFISSTKSAATGHISRSRTRGTLEPIRVRNTQERAKGADGLPPIESESRFRQSLTRRPKGGDSLDRDVSKAVGNENDEVWTVVSKKPESVLEFAPCLRSRVAAKKMESAPTAHPTKPRKTGQSKQDSHPAPRRRTEAEREAFFRRLSTPKTVTTIKRCAK